MLFVLDNLKDSYHLGMGMGFGTYIVLSQSNSLFSCFQICKLLSQHVLCKQSSFGVFVPSLLLTIFCTEHKPEQRIVFQHVGSPFRVLGNKIESPKFLDVFSSDLLYINDSMSNQELDNAQSVSSLFWIVKRKFASNGDAINTPKYANVCLFFAKYRSLLTSLITTEVERSESWLLYNIPS